MSYFLLAVFFSIALFVVLKLFARFQVQLKSAVLVHYGVCIAAGILLAGPAQIAATLSGSEGSWVVCGMLLGAFFVSITLLTGVTSQRSGIAVSSLASKLSLIIPVLFGLLVFKYSSRAVQTVEILGLLLAVIALVLTCMGEKSSVNSGQRVQAYYLPLTLFFVGGLAETFTNYVSFHFLTSEILQVFPVVVFGAAGLILLLLQIARREFPETRDIVGGVALGVCSFGSFLFTLKALAHFENNGAIFYPVMNLTVLIGSAFFAALFFGERFGAYKSSGLICGIIALLLLFYPQLSLAL